MKALGLLQTYIPNLSPTRRNSVARPRNVRSVEPGFLGTLSYYQDQHQPGIIIRIAGTAELELK